MPAEAEMYFVQSLMFLSTNSTMEKSNKGCCRDTILAG